MNIEAGKYYETRAGCKAAQVDVQREEYGPIRTRREIVPGVFGDVMIEKSVLGTTIVAEFLDPSAEELREAAHILNQLAEALEDKP